MLVSIKVKQKVCNTMAAVVLQNIFLPLIEPITFLVALACETPALRSDTQQCQLQTSKQS